MNVSSWRSKACAGLIFAVGYSWADGSGPPLRAPHVPDASVVLAAGLDRCLALERSRTVQQGAMTVLHVPARLRAEVGECGCTSRVLSYSITEQVPVDAGVQPYERGFGLLLAPPKVGGIKTLLVPLKADRELEFVGRLSVTLACQGPD